MEISPDIMPMLLGLCDYVQQTMSKKAFTKSLHKRKLVEIWFSGVADKATTLTLPIPSSHPTSHLFPVIKPDVFAALLLFLLSIVALSRRHYEQIAT